MIGAQDFAGLIAFLAIPELDCGKIWNIRFFIHIWEEIVSYDTEPFYRPM
jgi:hypothetical protein